MKTPLTIFAIDRIYEQEPDNNEKTPKPKNIDQKIILKILKNIFRIKKNDSTQSVHSGSERSIALLSRVGSPVKGNAESIGRGQVNGGLDLFVEEFLPQNVVRAGQWDV